MAYFAQLDKDNKVIDIQVVNDDVAVTEAAGVEFLTQLFGGNGWWKQTYIDGGSRKNYAGIGDTYDGSRDAFIPPQNYPSWTLNDSTCKWDPPTPYPDDGKAYEWNETTKAWDEHT